MPAAGLGSAAGRTKHGGRRDSTRAGVEKRNARGVPVALVECSTGREAASDGRGGGWPPQRGGPREAATGREAASGRVLLGSERVERPEDAGRNRTGPRGTGAVETRTARGRVGRGMRNADPRTDAGCRAVKRVKRPPRRGSGCLESRAGTGARVGVELARVLRGWSSGQNSRTAAERQAGTRAARGTGHVCLCGGVLFCVLARACGCYVRMQPGVPV